MCGIPFSLAELRGFFSCILAIQFCSFINERAKEKPVAEEMVCRLEHLLLFQRTEDLSFVPSAQTSSA